MSVTPNDIVAYGSQYMPEADGIQVGGTVDCTKRVAFYDISPSGTVDWVSSSASDTAVKAQPEFAVHRHTREISSLYPRLAHGPSGPGRTARVPRAKKMYLLIGAPGELISIRTRRAMARPVRRVCPATLHVPSRYERKVNEFDTVSQARACPYCPVTRQASSIFQRFVHGCA